MSIEGSNYEADAADVCDKENCLVVVVKDGMDSVSDVA